jgi:hypothetical protein
MTTHYEHPNDRFYHYEIGSRKASLSSSPVLISSYLTSLLAVDIILLIVVILRRFGVWFLHIKNCGSAFVFDDCLYRL